MAFVQGKERKLCETWENMEISQASEATASRSNVGVQPSPPLLCLPPKHHCLGSKDPGGWTAGEPSWSAGDAGHDF